MEQRCFERMESDRDVFIEDRGDAVHFIALTPDGQVWLEEVLGERRDVLVIRDRAIAAKLTRALFNSGLRFRISCGAELPEDQKFELFRAAFDLPLPTIQ